MNYSKIMSAIGLWFIYLLCTVVLGWGLGNINNFWIILGFLSIVVLIILTLIMVHNWRVAKTMRRKLHTFQGMKQHMQEGKEKVNENCETYWQNTLKLKKRGGYYLLLIFFLFAIINLFFGSILEKTEYASIIFMILVNLPTLSILITILNKEKIVNPLPLQKKDYPELFKIIEEVASEVDKNILNNLDVYLYGEINAGVSYNNGRYNLLLNQAILRAVNNDELHALLLHEFAHILYQDTKLSNIVKSTTFLWENLNKLFLIKYLFKIIGFGICDACSIYLSTVEFNCEIKADDLVKKKNYGQAFINCSSKIFMLYVNYNKLMLTPFYQSEEVYPNISEAHYQRFLEMYSIYKEEWFDLINKEIPQENSSHPTLFQRMQVFNCQPLISFNNDDRGLIREAKKMDKLIYDYKYFKDNWEDLHNRYYNYPLEAITAYEENGITLPYNLATIGLFYTFLCMYDKALNAFNEVLENEPDNITALQNKGEILLSKCDLEGLECLRKVSDIKKAYFKENSSKILGYCYLYGLQDKINEYKTWAEAKMEEVVQEEIYNLKHNNKALKFIPHNVEKSKLELLSKELKVLGAHGLYIAQKEDYKNHYVHLVFILSEIKDKRVQYVFDLMVYQLLDEYIKNYIVYFNYIIPRIYTVKNSKIFFTKTFN